MKEIPQAELSVKRTWRNFVYTVWDMLFLFIDRLKSTGSSRLSLSFQGCSYGKGFITTGPCSCKVRKEGDIRIGNNVTLLAGWRSNRVGMVGRVLLQTLGDGKIKIGDKTGGSSVVISSRSSIIIGDNVLLGGNVRIFDHDFHALDAMDRKLPMLEQESKIRRSDIKIGNDVFVGTNAIILKGVSVGDRTIIAAGSVLFRGDYPSDAIIAGNPAIVLNSKK